MEKKNTILLTVIAIATLLVAVVGATFAYFTATVNNDEVGQHTDTMKARTLVTANMKLGNTIGTENMLPGYKAVRSITITGTSGDTAVNTQIELTPNVPEAFGTDIKYYVYKIDNKASDNVVACKTPVEETSPEGTTPIQHYMATECGSYAPVEGTPLQVDTALTSLPTALNTEDANKVTLVKEGSFSGSDKVIIPNIEVANGTDVTYYVLVEYYNNPSAAQTGQGATFTVQMDLVEALTTTTPEA